MLIVNNLIILGYLTCRGNVRCGMHLVREISVGHLSGRESVRRGCAWSWKCPSGMCLVGKMSVEEVSVGEESVGEMSVGDVSGNQKKYQKKTKTEVIKEVKTCLNS